VTAVRPITELRPTQYRCWWTENGSAVPDEAIQYRALEGDTGETRGGHWCGLMAFGNLTYCAILPPTFGMKLGGAVKLKAPFAVPFFAAVRRTASLHGYLARSLTHPCKQSGSSGSRSDSWIALRRSGDRMVSPGARPDLCRSRMSLDGRRIAITRLSVYTYAATPQADPCQRSPCAAYSRVASLNYRK
jgi:hypothetical protein